jgi:DnaJ-class molecular chaperone
MSDENFYEILGVNQNATQTEIKKAYRQLAKSLMTDKWKKILLEEENFDCRDGRCSIVQSGTREAYFCSGPDGLCARTFRRVDEKWKQISEAYNTLSDSDEKWRYDAELNRESTSSFNSQKYSREEPTSSFGLEKNWEIQEIEEEFKKWSGLVNELDPNLWKPYDDWKQKAESLTLAELKKFKSQFLSALMRKVVEKKETLIQRIEDYLTVYVEEGSFEIRNI